MKKQLKSNPSSAQLPICLSTVFQSSITGMEICGFLFRSSEKVRRGLFLLHCTIFLYNLYLYNLYKGIIMKKLNILTIGLVFVFLVSGAHLEYGMAQTVISGGPLTEDQLLEDPANGVNTDHGADARWITKWYGPDANYTNNGGFAASAPMDLMSNGTGGKLTDASLSTFAGLLLTEDIDVEWPDGNGGTRGWTVFEMPAVANNTDRGGPADTYDTYAVIVIDAPTDLDSVMSPAHDDHAQIWINGKKWYNNSKWTGGHTKVSFNVEVKLQKGANVLLFRCGENTGGAYLNLHFDDATHDAVTIYPKDATDQQSFLEEIAAVASVEAAGKLTTTWADIRRK